MVKKLLVSIDMRRGVVTFGGLFFFRIRKLLMYLILAPLKLFVYFQTGIGHIWSFYTCISLALVLSTLRLVWLSILALMVMLSPQQYAVLGSDTLKWVCPAIQLGSIPGLLVFCIVTGVYWTRMYKKKKRKSYKFSWFTLKNIFRYNVYVT